ncbi:winged helix-turn-helix transcriptional regulator [Pseudomaricurvus alkylphenolicus]|uniref:MarR family winged helix-turn-helix transcriptional regulator n=1 Tax=Pseudomaricurvus alkylphenolicus TaxID=1306991 RepID=UPI00142209DD|nr:MarR family winged helix-turn-helix transcriptional regulator [Pseudomaricurvus alkylphenolicus]NIB44448.1 winged helix-turn-helix transcriptional regulator [Pseudomaricurvus alkylphenolicus]
MTKLTDSDIDWRQDNFGRLLLNAFKFTEEGILEELYNANFTDLRIVHLGVFRQIDDDGTRLTEIAERIGITKQAMMYLVNECEDMGYLERKSDPTDGRAKIVRFTPKGKKLMKRAKQIIADQEEALEKLIGKNNAKITKAALRKIGEQHFLSQPSNSETSRSSGLRSKLTKSSGRPPKIFQGGGAIKDGAKG